MDPHHDHSHFTHTAKCDQCDYVSEVHAHDDDSAVDMLSDDLAAHNKNVHGTPTDPAAIKDAVKAKMQTS